MGILVEFETVVIAINRRLEVAQDRIDPMKAAHVDAFALSADDFTLMGATNRLDGSKARQAVRNDSCGCF